MACRGVHVAISPAQAEQLLAAGGDEALMGLVERIEKPGDTDLAQSDMAWDAMHRCLTDGQLESRTGRIRWPLRAWARQLAPGDSYIVSLVSPERSSSCSSRPEADLGRVRSATST